MKFLPTFERVSTKMCVDVFMTAVAALFVSERFEEPIFRKLV